jgi:secreted PhoX family phosphatase
MTPKQKQHTLRPAARRATLSVAAAAAVAMLFVARPARAQFSNFTPLTASASPTLNEATPITFGNPNFTQQSIADRNTQLTANKPNTGAWDMLTLNETGPDAGRYLLTPFETSQSGVQRTDRQTGVTDTIWISPSNNAHVAFDASYWTPWGTYVTAEENWTTAPAGATTNPYGRLFEFKNPTTAPGITNPVTATSNAGANFTHKNVIPRTSHEGVQWDAAGNMYFIDELNGGSVYKYTTAANYADVLAGTADYFAAGTTSVLRVGDGTNANATGAFTWVPITNATGAALSGAITITDPNGVQSVDGRNTTELAAFKGTDYQRPEDMQVQKIGSGPERLYVTTTTTNEVYVIAPGTNQISVFANINTIDLATGLAVGATAFTSPDNLAIDSEGNIYIIEDRNGGVDNDIWFAKDINKDGDLLDAGEGIARWASNGTTGSEFTGLYFDPLNPGRAWVNIQHPTSGNDRTIEILVPEPASLGMLGVAAAAGLLRRRRRAV